MAVALGLVTLVGLLLVVLGWLGLVGRLPRNGFAGIRTPYTMRSDENWAATHRAAAPVLIFGGIAIVMAGLAFFPFSLAGKLGNGLVGGVTVALAVVLGADVLVAWQYGVRRAKAELGN
jgi:uncharacterized membrane protein